LISWSCVGMAVLAGSGASMVTDTSSKANRTIALTTSNPTLPNEPTTLPTTSSTVTTETMLPISFVAGAVGAVVGFLVCVTIAGVSYWFTRTEVEDDDDDDDDDESNASNGARLKPTKGIEPIYVDIAASNNEGDTVVPASDNSPMTMPHEYDIIRVKRGAVPANASGGSSGSALADNAVLGEYDHSPSSAYHRPPVMASSAPASGGANSVAPDRPGYVDVGQPYGRANSSAATLSDFV